jgi:hypothetical protein
LGFSQIGWAQEEETIPDQESSEADDSDASEEGVTQVEEEHTVVPGDTLWDLCAKYLNNPWYWPRVWSYNPELTNPHWIDPGQKVRFYPTGELPAIIDVKDERDFEVPESIPEPEEEEVLPEDLVSIAAGKKILQAKQATAVVLARDAFVSQQEIESMGKIRGSRKENELLSENDPIYVEFDPGNMGEVGKHYAVIRTEKEVIHPITNDSVGFYTRVVGAVQIVNVDGQIATGVITNSLIAIKRGDRVSAWMPELNKHIAPRSNAVELRGYIVGSRVDMSMVGERNVVFIDQGTSQGVEEGNVFDVVRRGDGLTPVGEDDNIDGWDEQLPVEIFGRVMIVDARPNVSTGYVIASLRELIPGDRVIMSVQ